jgi:4-alpha-glucanotransferase
VPFVAEDLGLVTWEVTELRKKFQLPGTRVLQYAFDGNAHNPHLPSNYSADTVAYSGTHDNPTTRQWFQELPGWERRYFCEYLRRSALEARDAAKELIRLAWSSQAALTIAPFQDLLNLGGEGRMNVPGRAEGNWRWRATRDMLSPRTFDWLEELTRLSNRSAPLAAPPATVREIAVTR